MPNGEEVERDRSFFFRHFKTITHIIGIATSIAMWWVGVIYTDKPDKRIAVYLLMCAIVISFLEFVFILNKCASCKEGSCALTLWKFIMAIDTWKKMVLYMALSVVCYLHPKEYWEAIIIGILLDITGLFYLIMGFRKGNKKQEYKYRQLEIK